MDVECAFEVVVTDVQADAFDAVITKVDEDAFDVVISGGGGGSSDSKAGVLIDTVSGSIASFVPDATVPTVKGLTVNVEPVQDLHGYDNPWPSGGGKNLVDVESPQTVTSQTELAKYATSEQTTFTASATIKNNAAIAGALNIYLYNGNSYARYVNVNVPASASAARYSVTVDCADTVYDNMRVVITGASAGYNLTVSDVQLEKGSTATAYSPYSNICPISGWDEVEVQRTGINVWDEEWESGFINNEGENEENAYYFRTKGYISIKPNTQYFYKCPTMYSDYGRFRFYDASKNFVSQIGTSIVVNRAFTTPENAYYMRFTTGEKVGVGVTYNNDISINYPSTDTAYHSGTDNDTYTIPLGQTVYGGTVDVVNGVLTVDRGYIASYNGETLPSAWISDRDVYASGTTPTTGAQVVYELATPITISLTPIEISVLTGQTNNIWADSGDVSVEYAADLKTYIDNKIAAAVAALS